MNFAFFGTSRFSELILDLLKYKQNIIPSLIVTSPDKPVGRKQIITPPRTKVWAEKNNLSVYQPASLKKEEAIERLKGFDFFVVASYGKIIPKTILDLPQKGTLNIHPSLLPKYRGPSPIQFQILENEQNIGTTIMLMDVEVDHGQILAQKEIKYNPHLPPFGTYTEQESIYAIESAELFAETLPKWLTKEMKPVEQNHAKATFTRMIKKEDGEINLNDDPLKNYTKYLAYYEWPKVFFFTEINGLRKRNIITDATFEEGKFIIKKIIPEGKKETFYRPSTSS